MHIMQPAQRPTVVLLHSSASSARQWDRLAEALAPQFRVRAIELPRPRRATAWRGDAPLTLADEAALAVPAARGSRRRACRRPFIWCRGRAEAGDDVSEISAQPCRLRAGVVPLGCSMTSRHQPPAQGRRHSRGLDARSTRHRSERIRRRSDSSISGPAPARGTHCPAANRLRSPRACVLCSNNSMRCFTSRFSVRSWPFSECRCCSSAVRAPSLSHVRIAELLRLTLPHAKHEVLPAMGHMGPITHATEVNQRVVEFLQVQDRDNNHEYLGYTRPMRELSVALR